MMRTTLMLLLGVALALAAPQSGRNRSGFSTIPKAPRSPISNSIRSPIPNSPRNLVPILVDERNMPDENGRFDFRYQTGDGISHQAQGNPVGDKSYSVQGSYSYTSPEGQLVEVRYIADENGFQAFGDHLPTPPPVPAHALAQIRAAEQAFAGQRSGGSASGLRRAPPSRLG